MTDRFSIGQNDTSLYYLSTIADPSVAERWLALPLARGPTRAPGCLWTQIVGKVRLALAPPVNHWWHAALAVTARGLTTRAMPYAGGSFEIALDFIEHQVRIDTSDGRSRPLALASQTVAEFDSRVFAMLRARHHRADLADAGRNSRAWAIRS